MASNINPYNVDGSFPIAGQDNSSQGFRNNFTNIQSNFVAAEGEISDLQSKAITTSALTGQDLNNDMAFTQIRRPQLTAWTQSLHDNGVIAGAVSLDFNVANFQKITTGAPITLSFVNWPTSSGSTAGYGVMRIWINLTDVTHTLTLPTSVNIAVSDIAGYNSTTNTITFDAPGNYIFDISSIDGGSDYQIFDVTRNRASFRDPYFYFNNTVNSTLLVGYGSLLPLAQQFELGEDKVSSFGSYNSVAVGNLTVANIAHTAIDNGNQMGGYSVTGIQGNVLTGAVYGVNPGDMIGYFNGLSYTGYNNFSGNIFQNTGSVTFFASGANVAYGLGGNVCISTARDGGNNSQALYQAVGIENDQSTHIYGNLYTKTGIVEGGTYVTFISSVGSATLAANSATSTFIVDCSSASGTAITYANIQLPVNPVDRQTIKIVAAAPIATANIWATNAISVRYVPTNKFAAGNVAARLTYIQSAGAWYVS